MFEEVPDQRASKILSSRPFGFSNIRLLPKSKGVRLITNLKKRQTSIRNGAMVLGRSINKVMAPVFNAITYEKVRVLQRDRLDHVADIASHINLTSSAALCFPSVTCSRSWRRSERR
jgi:hypothetical protein